MEYTNYQPSGLAAEIFSKRYSIHEGETFKAASERVAYHITQAEMGDNIAKYRAEFFDVLEKNLFFPGGRIWYGAGRPKGQLLNCFVIPTHDSREGWGKSVSDMIIISGTGGGLGLNGSPVRPRGSSINGSGGKATGTVSLMKILNAAGDVIKAGGGRRVALMFALGINHGDIVEFLDTKLDKKELTNANVSVVMDENPEQFFKYVKEDAEIELKFHGKVVGKAKAKDIWMKIVLNALKGGEPGILNGYLANKMSNIHYIAPLVCTNPCGEIWLSAYDNCCLGSIVLPRFVDVTKKAIDWDMLKSVVATGVRFLDNVLTVNNYPLPEIKDTASNIRRIGLGVTGLHDMLLLLGLRYNSAAGLEMVDKVMNTIKNAAYLASIELAKEKGPFPKFDPVEHLKSGFIKTLRPSIREAIREFGIRNCALLTIAPVGTGSMVCGISNEICGVSSGIEPVFAPAYWRRFRDGEELRKEVVIHPLFKWFMDNEKGVKHFQGAHDLKTKDHFEMQRTCQRHLDNACSKTINLPFGTSPEDLSDLYMEFLPELKGVTVYPEGSREDQPLTPMPLEEAMKAYETAKIVEATAGNCAGGSCEL
jgi:ribonucleoside-diphosphate reductase alpha chain